MANTTITALPTASTIDGANDFLAIDTASPSATNKINRNVLLGITSQPVGLTDTQTLTNKTLSSPTISGPTLSGTVLGTYTLGGTPTFPASVVTLTGTQTLTNKTLTSPVISGGTIDNTTITVDSINGHTTSTIVTVAGVQMNNGTIGTASAVVTNSIADAAVTPAKLVAGTGTGWTTTTWSPIWTNLTVGNGVVTARYIQTGKMVIARVTIVFGSTTSVSGQVIFSLPVTSVAYAGTATTTPLGSVQMFDSSAVTVYNGNVLNASTTTAELRVFKVDGTYSLLAVTTSLIPFTWAINDEIECQFIYEAA